MPGKYSLAGSYMYMYVGPCQPHAVSVLAV